jgi:large subunit ribosomal protein L10
VKTNRKIKENLVSKLNEQFNNATSVVVAHYQGMTVDQLNSLRSELRKSEVKFQVAKNRLVKLAVKGTKFSDIDKFLTGPTAIVFSDDPVSAAKGIVDFTKENKNLKVVGGVLDGKVLELAEVHILATLPSLDQLRGKIIGLLQAPATKVAGILQAPASQLARVVDAKSKKNG